MIAERLGTRTPKIPKSMEAPFMRLVLLPEFEGYPTGTDVSMSTGVATPVFCLKKVW